ncbi:ArsR family transcriptional regulator [Natrialbaceae archaeon A-chndr2]
MDSSEDGRHIDPAVSDAIRTLGNDCRLEILFTLAEREWELKRQGHALSFTELYERSDVESTSQFSYHLTQLVGPFVAETSDGYRLTYAGEKIVRTVRSGLYESSSSFEPLEVDGTCPFCRESALVADSRDERFIIRCSACDTSLLADSFPRSQASDRSAAEIVDSFGTRLWSSALSVSGGVCPECCGSVDIEVDTQETRGVVLHTVSSTCRQCRMVVHFPVEVFAMLHPAVADLLRRRGISVLETPLWEFFAHLTGKDWTTDVRSRSPLEVRFEIAVDGDRLSLEMDDSLTVSRSN